MTDRDEINETKVIITIKNKNARVVAERMEAWFLDGDYKDQLIAHLDYDNIDYGEPDDIELGIEG